MTPAVGWTEHDYYRASRAARAAWQQTNAQLELGLEETVGEGWRQPTVSSSPSLKRVASHRDASPGGGLTASGAEPQHPSIHRTRTSAGAPADTHAGGSAPPPNTTGPGRVSPDELRDQGR